MDQVAKQADGGLQITKELLQQWNACSDGMRWFLRQFPQGGDYCAAQTGLRADQRFDDARWLTDKAFEHAMTAPASVKAITCGFKAESDDLIAEAAAISVDATDGADDAQIGSSGDGARIGSSGDDARINADGVNPVIAVAGLGTKVQAGDGGAVAVAYHDGTRTRFAVGYVGEGLKAMTWYSVNGAGEFVELED